MRQERYKNRDDEVSGPFWLPYLFFLIVTLILAIPIIKDFGNWGTRDWDLFTTLNASVLKSVVEYGQFPFWNPYIGGGNILFAHPEVAVLNPLFLLQLIFGTLGGLKIQILLMYFVGMAGFYLLSRRLGLTYWASFLPPAVAMLSSYLALHFAVGHIPFHYFALFPWLMLFYKMSLEKPIHIFSAAGVVAFLVLGSGAAVPFVFSGFFLFLFSLSDIGEKYKMRPPFFVVFAFAVGLLLAAVKFFPMLDYISHHPWIPQEGIVVNIPVSALYDVFFNFDQSMYSEYIGGDRFVWGWHEYGTFIGPFVFILAVVGFVTNFRRTWHYLLLSLIGIILALGSFASWSLWDLIHQLPGFQSMRVPSRFSLLTLICLAITAGYGLDFLLRQFKHRKGLLTVVVFTVVVSTHLFVCLPVLSEAFPNPPEKPQLNSEFKQVEGDPNRMYWTFLSNRGTIRAGWLSAYRHGRGIMGFDGQTMEWYSDNDAVRVNYREFTPNRIRFDISTKTGGALIVSQGYDRGWHAVDDREIKPRSDLVSFSVLPSDRSIEIYYFPKYFILGLIISIVSLLAVIGFSIFYLRSRQEFVLD